MDPTNLNEMNRIWMNTMQDMFRASMTAMTTLQEEVVRMTKVTNDKSVEGWQVNQSMVNEWIATFKKGQNDLLKMVDETFQKAQTNLHNLGNTGEKAPKASTK